MAATVLMVKRYPSEEFGVILDTSPAVFTLRDVQYFYPNANNLIQEGSRIILHTPGYWDVYTCAIHRANISIWTDKAKTNTPSVAVVGNNPAVWSDNAKSNKPSVPAGNNPAVRKQPLSLPPLHQQPLRKRRVTMKF